jgi:predicted Zn finger-like uncharacterized protein
MGLSFWQEKMSSSITQCPGCYTRFKVTTEQLVAHNGIVRCGLCSAIFNAPEHLQDDEPSPQLKLPIPQQEDEATPAEVIADIANPVEHFLEPTVTTSDELETLFQQIEAVDEIASAEISPQEPKKRNWPWIVGSLVFLLLGVAQALYFFRVDIAAQLPGLKPVLSNYCELLKCTIPLPEKIEMMSIESSDLEADALQPNVVNLTALLHNRAEFTQACPNLELSLTDMQDRVVARRVFTPAEYLKAGEDPKRGLSSNREMNIQLHLDTFDLKPTGYKLFLFYAQQ